MKDSSKKRNPLLKDQVSYLSRSKRELIGLIAPEAGGETAGSVLQTAEICLAQFALRAERFSLAGDLSRDAAHEFVHAAMTRGVRALIVASPDGHLPGALAFAAAAEGEEGLPIIRVPVEDGARRGTTLLQPLLDDEAAQGSFATMGIGEAGAKNAALLVVAMIAATGDRQMNAAWDNFRTRQTMAVLRMTLPRVGSCDLSPVIRR
jgi:phosphoribosylcarboxyaminoimidazole (NCAIR) mutase